MIVLLIAMTAAAVPPPPAVASPAAPRRQADATVRILVPAELRFARIEQTDPSILRSIQPRVPGGPAETVRVIEFQ
jgi:hypothetical protein